MGVWIGDERRLRQAEENRRMALCGDAGCGHRTPPLYSDLILDKTAVSASSKVTSYKVIEMVAFMSSAQTTLSLSLWAMLDKISFRGVSRATNETRPL